MQWGRIAKWCRLWTTNQREYITHIEIYWLSVDRLGVRKSLQAGNQGVAEQIPSALGAKSADPAIAAPLPFEAIRVRRVEKLAGGRTLTKLNTLVGHVEGVRRQSCLFIRVERPTITASAKLMAARCSSASTPISSMASDKVRMSSWINPRIDNQLHPDQFGQARVVLGKFGAPANKRFEVCYGGVRRPPARRHRQ